MCYEESTSDCKSQVDGLAVLFGLSLLGNKILVARLQLQVRFM